MSKYSHLHARVNETSRPILMYVYIIMVCYYPHWLSIVSLYICLIVRALKGKRLQLSAAESIMI